MLLRFPAMQWFGDGKQINIILRNQTFTFNLEAFVDIGANAAVRAIVTDTEDVIQAFGDRLNTVADCPWP